ATTRRVNSLIITTTLQQELAESNPDPKPELQFLPHAARVPPTIPELKHPSQLTHHHHHSTTRTGGV
ncbi:hypothetical protein FCV25MIE_34833, partial [Fagus crenata]